MKKFNLITGIQAALVLCGFLMIIGCSNDDVDISVPNHRVIYTSEMDFQNTIEVNNDLTFGDVSPGVVSRLWSFPEGVVDIVDSDNDLTSGNDIVKAVFNQTGEFNVTLNQSFKGDAYVGQDLRGSELDTTIVVTVLEPVQVSFQAFYINDDDTTGAPLDLSDGAENEVTASSSIRYVYTVVGAPEEFNWAFEGGNPSEFTGEDAEVDIKYTSLGVYDTGLIASRERPFGRDTIAYADLIKVVPSTDPVDLDKVTEKEGKIALEFSRDMDPLSLDETTFTVSIENGGDIISPVVELAEIDPDAGNVVLLSLLNDAVYNDDNVTVSYTPGLLRTLDLVDADAFTDVPLSFELNNILIESNFDHSFETTTAADWPYQWWGAPWDGYTLDVTGTNVQDGNKSAEIDFLANGGMIIGSNDATGAAAEVTFEAGQTYEFGMWIYVEAEWFTPGNYPLPGLFASDIRIYPTDFSFEAIPVTFEEDFPIGEWVYTRNFVTVNSGGPKGILLRGYNEGADMNLKFFMDNLVIAPVNLRP